MAKSDFTKYTKTFVDETVPSGGRKYSISGTGTGQTITDTTAYPSITSSQQKKLDANTLNWMRGALNNIADGKYDYMSLDTSTSSGDDYTIRVALTNLGWTDCIE